MAHKDHEYSVDEAFEPELAVEENEEEDEEDVDTDVDEEDEELDEEEVF